MCSRKTTRGAKAVCLCMISSVFHHLGSGCFFRSPAFFRNPAANFAGLRSGTFFRPKEDLSIHVGPKATKHQSKMQGPGLLRFEFCTPDLLYPTSTWRNLPTLSSVFGGQRGPPSHRVTVDSPMAHWAPRGLLGAAVLLRTLAASQFLPPGTTDVPIQRHRHRHHRSGCFW